MPNQRNEFERNMHLLKEMIQNDRLKLSESSMRSLKGVLAVRYAPNQRINLLTINEMARLMANTVTQMEQKKNLKL